MSVASERVQKSLIAVFASNGPLNEVQSRSRTNAAQQLTELAEKAAKLDRELSNIQASSWRSRIRPRSP